MNTIPVVRFLQKLAYTNYASNLPPVRVDYIEEIVGVLILMNLNYATGGDGLLLDWSLRGIWLKES